MNRNDGGCEIRGEEEEVIETSWRRFVLEALHSGLDFRIRVACVSCCSLGSLCVCHRHLLWLRRLLTRTTVT